jgi:hypothetical protein
MENAVDVVKVNDLFDVHKYATVSIKAHFMMITGYDDCCSAILSHLEYRHVVEEQSVNNKKEKGINSYNIDDLYFDISSRYLEERLLYMFSRPTISKSIKKLFASNFITTKFHKNDTISASLNIEVIKESIKLIPINSKGYIDYKKKTAKKKVVKNLTSGKEFDHLNDNGGKEFDHQGGKEFDHLNDNGGKEFDHLGGKEFDQVYNIVNNLNINNKINNSLSDFQKNENLEVNFLESELKDSISLDIEKKEKKSKVAPTTKSLVNPLDKYIAQFKVELSSKTDFDSRFKQICFMWLKYKYNDKKQKYTNTAWVDLFKKYLDKTDIEYFASQIEYSIANNYSGSCFDNTLENYKPKVSTTTKKLEDFDYGYRT